MDNQHPRVFINPTAAAMDAGIVRLRQAKRNGVIRRHPERKPGKPNGEEAGLMARKAGAEGANKIIVTDYRFAGPGFATRKPVGRGCPQTPLALRATA